MEKRGEVVPRTGKRRHGRVFRHPKTTTRIRSSQIFEDLERTIREEDGILVEGRKIARRICKEGGLPTLYSDLRISADRNRSWKRHRLAQVKGASHRPTKLAWWDVEEE